MLTDYAACHCHLATGTATADSHRHSVTVQSVPDSTVSSRVNGNLGVAMDTEPYPVLAGLLIRKAVTWRFRIPNAKWL